VKTSESRGRSDVVCEVGIRVKVASENSPVVK
jgi:hypothetical protein